MESVIEFLNNVIGVIDGFGDMLDSYWERALHWCFIAYLKIKMGMITIAWAIAKTFLNSLGISAAINAAWASLDSYVLDVFTYLRIPEGLNMLIQAYVTRFIMGLMP